jgi:D-alanyl-D-alanine dipeptidase
MNLINFAFAQGISSPLDLTGFIQEYCRTGVNLNFCLQGIYNLLVAIAVVVAFFMFLFGAFENLLSAIPDVKMQGKNRMKNAIIGLGIIFVSGVVLYWINPSIFNARLIMYQVQFSVPEVIISEIIEKSDSASLTNEDKTLKPQVIDGKTVEIGCSVPPPPGEIVSIPYIDGIKISARDKRISKLLIPYLQKASEVARKNNSKLIITSAYRTLEHQKELRENKERELRKQHPDWSEEQIQKEADIWVAKPGESTHNCGRAVDVIMDTPECNLVALYRKYGTVKGAMCKEMIECWEKLENMMCKAGFVRYKPECWHFEFGTNRWNKGRQNGKCVAE